MHQGGNRLWLTCVGSVAHKRDLVKLPVLGFSLVKPQLFSLSFGEWTTRKKLSPLGCWSSCNTPCLPRQLCLNRSSTYSYCGSRWLPNHNCSHVSPHGNVLIQWKIVGTPRPLPVNKPYTASTVMEQLSGSWKLSQITLQIMKLGSPSTSTHRNDNFPVNRIPLDSTEEFSPCHYIQIFNKESEMSELLN